MVILYLLVFTALGLLFLLLLLRDYLLKLFRIELHTAWALHLASSAETTSASMEGEEYEEDLLAGDPDDVPMGDESVDPSYNWGDEPEGDGASASADPFPDPSVAEDVQMSVGTYNNDENLTPEVSHVAPRGVAALEEAPKRQKIRHDEGGPSDPSRAALVDAQNRILDLEDCIAQNRRMNRLSVRPVPPDIFSGAVPEDWPEWLESTMTYLELGKVPQSEWVNYAAQYLVLAARKYWTSQKLRLTALKQEITWSVFVSTLSTMYDNVDRVQVARLSLSTLLQKSGSSGVDSLQDYINDFLTLTSELAALGQGLSESAQVFEFRKGLAPELKRQTALDPATHKGYTEFSTLLQVVLRLHAEDPTYAEVAARGMSLGQAPNNPRGHSRGRGGRGHNHNIHSLHFIVLGGHTGHKTAHNLINLHLTSST
jgi:hypothetical protein